MLREFKEFALKGNMLDLAVGVVIGAAFTLVITALVGEVLMPLLSLATGGVDFSQMFIDLSGKGYATLEEAKAAKAPTLNYGIFIQAFIQFLIVAFALFLIIRQVNRWQKPPPSGPDVKNCPLCLTSIPLAATRCASCCADLGSS